MKLISLYIENFGGLRQYRLDFEAGVTTIHAPNGFGKTTLAEFIRAMFYGFPRKAKTLDKSRRQKYTPWQGGKFGGNLVFEYEGQRYRIERTFGATPKGDSFNLIDLGTNKKSTRFSENIGIELFQLDSDSFERSTYMPQLHDLTSLTTDGIQAKLGDLVEDTGDMGNYEKAVAALKGARSGFIPYRGSGGTVAEAQHQVSLLQTEVDRCAGLESQLDRLKEEIGQIQTQQEARKQQREDIHARILRSSEAAAVAAAHREYGQITGTEARLKGELDQLNLRYPKGLPSEEQIRLARDTAAKAAVLAAQQITTQEDRDAEAFLAENRNRFEAHIPTREELEACRGRISRRHALLTEAESIGLSEAEKAQYAALLPLQESGKLEESRLEQLEHTSRELTRTQHRIDETHIPEDDLQQLEVLKAYFSAGVPEEAEILARHQELMETYALRREKAELLEQLAQIGHRKTSLLLPLLALLSLGGIGAGIALLAQALTLYGALALGTGILALAAAGIGSVRLAGQNRSIRESRAALQSRAEDTGKRIDALDQAVADFTGRYTSARPLTDALNEIRHNREELKELAAGIAAATARRKQLTAEADRLRGSLREALGDGDFDRAILELRLARGQFRDLQDELTAAAEKVAQLRRQGEELEQELTGFLGAYFESPDPAHFHSLLSDLQRSSEYYAAALARVDSRNQRQADHDRQQAACEEILSSFFETLGIPREASLREQLLQIRDDRRRWDDLTAQHRNILLDKEQFEQQHRNELDKALPEAPEDLTRLRMEEHRLNEAEQADTARLFRQQQLLQQTQDQFRRLPELQDELACWQEKHTSDREKARLLDDTMAFLEKARESLQNSYLGPVRSSFQNYMHRLMDEDARQILLTTDLDVQLERNGQARELGYFSAGQADTVMLCMRLALVDALFGDVKPFVILDDPFVNLDDHQTGQALELLKELANDRQILYLTCSSSRTL